MNDDAAQNCHYCGRQVFPRDGKTAPNSATIDHYYPNSIVRQRARDLVVVSCNQCNHLKASTPPEVFERYVKLFGWRGINDARAYRLFCYNLMLAGLKGASFAEASVEAFFASQNAQSAGPLLDTGGDVYLDRPQRP